MYNIMQFCYNEDDLLVLCSDLAYNCRDYALQFLPLEQQKWIIPPKTEFQFHDCFSVGKMLAVFSQRMWDGISSFSGAEDVLSISLEISHCGEMRKYQIAVVPRIRCMDASGKILSKYVGRYQMFRSAHTDDQNIYICGTLAEYLRNFTAVKIKGAG